MKDVEYLKKYYQGNLDNAIKRLEKGEPVQYIVGNVNFYGYTIEVNKNVLIPRFETEELVEKTIIYIKKYFDKPIDIVDIGTGSGCIAITISKELNIHVDAVDISSKALIVAQKNKKNLNADVSFIEGDLLEPLTKKYDVIISNPPYIRYNEKIMDIVRNHEPSIALYADNDGLYFYEQILKNAKKYLKEKSLIAFEIGSSQGQDMKVLAFKYLKNPKVVIEKDYQGFDRFVFIWID